jgi:diaminopimelate decarboxylase
VVLGLLVAVVSFGGGLSVSAEEMEPALDVAEYEERLRKGPRFVEPDDTIEKNA